MTHPLQNLSTVSRSASRLSLLIRTKGSVVIWPLANIGNWLTPPLRGSQGRCGSFLLRGA